MRGITLSRHILEQEEKYVELRGELSRVLAQVGFVAKVLARELRRAALVGKLGLVGDRNATGDAQKRLDIFANETFVQAFAEDGLVAAILSEELEEVKLISCGDHARYILCTDPLDGSSNTDINGSLGTIFGIHRRERAGSCASPDEVLRKGSGMVAAGYVLYSTSTVLVYTCGHGVNGFTLDHDIGEFLLSHENIRLPMRGKSFAANLGRMHEWDPRLKEFVEYLTTPDAASHRPYSLRYSGALVGDVHRNLLEGGIYFYPADGKHKEGKLRLVYECAPLAYIVEQAGGQATTGTERVLEIQPVSIHQRVPLAIGSSELVGLYEAFTRDRPLTQEACM
jgi:fructose-1,6-bisphosphatase I